MQLPPGISIRPCLAALPSTIVTNYVHPIRSGARGPNSSQRHSKVSTSSRLRNTRTNRPRTSMMFPPFCAQHVLRHGKKTHGVAVFDTTIVDKDTIEDDDFALIEG